MTYRFGVGSGQSVTSRPISWHFHKFSDIIWHHDSIYQPIFTILFFIGLQIQIPLRTYYFYHSPMLRSWDMTSFITPKNYSWIYVLCHTLRVTVTSFINRFPKFIFCLATNNNTFMIIWLVLFLDFYFSKCGPTCPKH